MTSTPAHFPPEVALLIEAAGSAPSADNSQPWCFDWDGNSLTGRARWRGGFPIDYHATKLALGAATENLIWAIQSIGQDINAWHFGTPEEDGVFARGPVTQQTKFDEPTDPPLWKLRHTNRLPYRPEINADIAPRLVACQTNRVRTRVITGAGIPQAADWVRQASEIRFQTREVNEWFASSLRYGNSPEELTDGLHVNTLALPPGGVVLLKLMSDWNRLQWLNRMRAYKLFAAIEAANFRKAPLIIAIVSPPDKNAAFDAGRCLQQVWLRITELGLAAHPYYVVSDLLNRLELGSVPVQCATQAVALQKRLRAELGPDETLHCLLRVGKPIGNIQNSGRLPPKDIMCNATKRS